MPSYKVAHVRKEGQDMIVIPLESHYGSLSNEEQNEIRDELQLRSIAAGLAGTVVTVWDAGLRRMGFLAPHPWRAFFSSINLRWVFANINGEISW